MKKKLVVLSGAGVSAESGLATFRDAGGLWEGYDVMKVASIQGWHENPSLVLEFYNFRRKQALEAFSNQAHHLIAQLEQFYEVKVITQNVDNLHERAGSSDVMHLHGQLFQSRSTAKPHLIYDIKGWELNLGDLCELGSQLRPNIVWFGEPVPLIEKAAREVSKADVLIVIGTSLTVYPAASLVDYVSGNAKVYVIDPNSPYMEANPNMVMVNEKAVEGMKKVFEILKKERQ